MCEKKTWNNFGLRSPQSSQFVFHVKTAPSIDNVVFGVTTLLFLSEFDAIITFELFNNISCEFLQISTNNEEMGLLNLPRH